LVKGLHNVQCGFSDLNVVYEILLTVLCQDF